MHTEAHLFSVPNDCLWYDKLWGPSQRVVTLFHNHLKKSQILNVGAIRLPAQAIMDVLNMPPTISIVGESFSTEGTSCSTGAVSVL